MYIKESFNLPKTATELALKEYLLSKGFDPANIEFNDANSAQRYLRVGYWSRIADISDINYMVEEVSHEDDDCGTLFHYIIK